MISKHLFGNEKTFMDLFSGTNVVGRYFKSRFKVISNDILYFSYIMGKATVQLNSVPSFDTLKLYGISDPFKYLQFTNLDTYSGDFITKNYSLSGPDNRKLFTINNAKRIDFIRNTIQYWLDNSYISKIEFYYLLNSLIEAVPFVSNMTGTYAAYLKNWDKRALKPLRLVPSEVFNNHVNNKSFNTDAIKLGSKIYSDIVYIDTPYNSRQYSSNYHVLETIARWDYPSLHGKTGQRDTDSLKSDFSRKRNAKSAMKKLLDNLHAKHVCISYSTDGIIPENELTEIIKEHSKNNTFDIVRIPYRKYKSKIVNEKHKVYELIYYYQPKNDSDNNQLNVNYNVKKINNIRKNINEYGFIKSPLNYVGGKYKLLNQLINYFPDHFNIFLDLFSGGGNVGINVNADKVYFNDINTKVNNLFRYFQGKNPYKLIEDIENVIRYYNLSKTNFKGFIKLRDDYNKSPNSLYLYVLVAYSFNYQFRFNNDLKYNNPFGKNRSHFSKNMENRLIKFVNRLNSIDAKFTDKYFTEFNTSILDDKSFVYADPPYLITNGSYNDGNRGFVNWSEKQEKELYRLLDDLDKRNIKFALSNVLKHKGVVNDLLLQWSKKYNVHHLNYSYYNSSYNTKHLSSDEVIITNY